MPIYEVEAPDGRILEIEGNQPPSEKELDDIFASVGSTQQPAQPKKVGVDLTPSGLINQFTNTVSSGLASPIVALKEGLPLNEAYDLAKERGLQARANDPMAKAQDFITDMAAYSALPILRGGGIARFGANALIQGGAPGLLEGLKEGKPLQGLGGGTAIASAIQSIPYVGKPIVKGLGLVPGVTKGIAQNIARINPETLERVVKPDSIALDLSKDQAQNLLMNTTEQVRNAYNNVLAKRGQEVGEAIKNLRQGEYAPVKVDDIKDDITSIFNQYQGDKINPARNMTGNLENELLSLAESGRINANELVDMTKNNEVLGEFMPDKKDEAYNILAQATNRPKQWIQSQLGAKNAKGGVAKRQETIGEMIENTDDRLADLPASEYNYYKPTGDKTDTDLARRAYDDVINNKFYQQASPEQVMFNELNNKYKDILDNFVKTSDFETASVQFDNLLNGLPDNIQKDFIEKFSNDISSLNKSDTISPIDLQNMKTQVGKMVNWSDETSRQYKNPILEQLYGKIQGRLSNLSPELANANRRFADVVNFKNNEGLRRILKAGNNIDTASSALKNYNSTVTKGNINRNVQDLENLLVSEGYEPFINQIDDVNAAMDLLGMRTTGDSIQANIATAALRPLLRAYRGLNRVAPKLQPLRQNVGRTVIPSAVQLMPLQGGVVYNDYRN